MKMKAIFILLNVVLAVAFLVIFLSPLVLLGGDWFSVFWSRNWIIAVVFVIALGAVDGYFAMNWKLFTGLEKEDWAGVASFLEKRIFRAGWLPSGRVRLLLNTYLVTSNTEGILALEAYLARRKPDLVGRFSLSFGIPHLLAKDPHDSESFFRGLLTAPRLADRDWVAWNHAFSLLQVRRPDDARGALTSLMDTVKEPVLLLLTVYLLDVLAKADAELEERIAAARGRLASGQTPASFQALVDKASSNTEVVILSKLVQDAVLWLFAAPGRTGPAVPLTGNLPQV
jgi:hypothetical protein